MPPHRPRSTFLSCGPQGYLRCTDYNFCATCLIRLKFAEQLAKDLTLLFRKFHPNLNAHAQHMMKIPNSDTIRLFGTLSLKRGAL